MNFLLYIQCSIAQVLLVSIRGMHKGLLMKETPLGHRCHCWFRLKKIKFISTSDFTISNLINSKIRIPHMVCKTLGLTSTREKGMDLLFYSCETFMLLFKRLTPLI